MPRTRSPSPGSKRLRGKAAAGRLQAARQRFERSTIDLRKAAFDHVDRQIFLSAALRASIERLADKPKTS